MRSRIASSSSPARSLLPLEYFSPQPVGDWGIIIILEFAGNFFPVELSRSCASRGPVSNVGKFCRALDDLVSFLTVCNASSGSTVQREKIDKTPTSFQPRIYILDVGCLLVPRRLKLREFQRALRFCQHRRCEKKKQTRRAQIDKSNYPVTM